MTEHQHSRSGRERPRQRQAKLPQLSWYVLGQILGPVALLTFLLTCVILLTQSLRLLDLVINRGQSAPTFVYLTVLIMPGLLVIILPIAFFFGTLFTLSRLNGDSELVVMASAGYSQRQLALPVFIAAALVMLMTWANALWLMPAGQRALNAKVLDIRADIGAALLNEGEFNPPAPGLTVFIRQLGSDGQIRGILVHDSRDVHRPITYLAERGVLAQTPQGARLIMLDGTVEQSAQGGRQLSVLKFQRDVFDLDQFAGPARANLRQTSERFLGELLYPTDPSLTQRTRNVYLAEAHNRLSQPLYCLAFAMIALAAILRGRRQRGALAMRLTMAALAAAAIRIAGYGVAGPAAGHPALISLFYIIPLMGAGLALAVLMGYSPSAILARRRRAIEAPGMSWSWTLYRYLAVQFFLGVAVVYSAFLVLAFSIDIVNLLNRTAGHAVTTAVIVGMAMLQLPDLGQKMLPFAILLGGVFTFARLSRSQELVATRAAGVSAWDFLLPPLAVAVVIGIFAVTVFTPVSARMFAEFAGLEARYVKGEASQLSVSQNGLWLRQGDEKQQSVIHALRVADQGQHLEDVIVFLYGANDHFTGRIDAKTGQLQNHAWLLRDAWTSDTNGRPAHHNSYLLNTTLTPEQIQESFASPDTLSFWDLPGFIRAAQAAGFSATRYQLYLYTLYALPALFAAMVLMAASFSLRLSREGGVAKVILFSAACGFAVYFFSDLTRVLGQSGAVPVLLAATAPAIAAILIGMTLLFNQEDG